MPTTTELLTAVYRAAGAPRPDPTRDAVLEARDYGITWRAITDAVNRARTAEPPRGSNAIRMRYGPAAAENRATARKRAQAIRA